MNAQGGRGGGGGGRGGGGRGRGTRFDTQAAGFDRRAGLGEASRQVAAAVLAITDAARAVVLEIGPGTGEIGHSLAAGAGRYAGIDLSRPMLEEFAARVRPTTPVLLVEADGDGPWPVRDAAVDAVFSSRAAHLLVRDHVVRETRRVCRSGGHLLLGRVQRSAESVRSRLRDKRRELLEAAGMTVGSGRHSARLLLDTLAEHGATPVGPVPVARWTVTTSAAEVITGWEENPAMGGAVMPLEARQAIVHELRSWAEAELGPLDASREAVETYLIEGVQLR